MKKTLLIFLLLLFCMPVLALEESICGIGAGIFKEPYNKKTLVYKIVPNAPAAKSYLPLGSEILEINGKKTKSMSIDKILSSIRGKEGTDVTLLIKNQQNKKETYTITRSYFKAVERATDPVFDIHWQQVVPSDWENAELIHEAILPKLSYTYMQNTGKYQQYWAERRIGFTKGYDACKTYAKNEQNTCLMNLVNREINKTMNDEQLLTQQNLAKQQAVQSFTNNLNQINQTNQLQNINNSIQQQNFQLQNINNNLNRVRYGW